MCAREEYAWFLLLELKKSTEEDLLHACTRPRSSLWITEATFEEFSSVHINGKSVWWLYDDIHLL